MIPRFGKSGASSMWQAGTRPRASTSWSERLDRVAQARSDPKRPPARGRSRRAADRPRRRPLRAAARCGARCRHGARASPPAAAVRGCATAHRAARRRSRSRASLDDGSSTIGMPSRRRKRPACISKRRGRGRSSGSASAGVRHRAAHASSRETVGCWLGRAPDGLRSPTARGRVRVPGALRRIAFGFAKRCARAGIPHFRAGGGVASPGAVDREALCCDLGLEQAACPLRATPCGVVSRSPSAATGQHRCKPPASARQSAERG